MTLYDSFILGLVQGLTEFLPISSSGHLVLMQNYLGLSIAPQIMQDFDIMLHGGSLLAILFYFQKTWRKIIKAPFKNERDGSPPLLMILIIGTIPVAIVGYLSANWIAGNTMTPLFVAFGFIATGSILIASSWYESRYAAKESYDWKQAIGAGVGQALGVLPGFSRSGFTIASGRLVGLTAHRATELAFLLAAPALGGALALTAFQGTHDLLNIGEANLAIGFIAAFISSLFVMRFFLLTIRKYGIWMWAVYLFAAASLIITDEMLPLIWEVPDVIENLEPRIIVGVLFMALLLEAIPFTSAFVPGFVSMIAIGAYLHDDPWTIAACIPIGASALILGHLIGYIPARQARKKIHWNEKADERLMKTQRFFKKYGFWAVFFGGWWAPFRPFISITAGLGNMRTIPYLFAIVTGSIAWVTFVLTSSAGVLGGALQP
jgi:undecaprenyl-diphosphatase